MTSPASPPARPVLSAQSGRVKEARKLRRRSVRSERRLFLAEGWKALEAALSADAVVEVFATVAACDEHAELLGGIEVHLVDERALESLAEAVSPQGLVAVCRPVDVAQIPAGRMLALCADVRDPGNAGTVIRTADAVGAAAVVLAGNSVDPYNSKTVRATVGSLFHVPLVLESDPFEAIARVRAAGYTVLATDGAGELDLFEAESRGVLSTPIAWLFGNEAWGLPEDLAAAADHRIRIPIAGRAESLNLSTAAAVCLYAGLRVTGR